ncbi:MAG TPA: 4Fe-4S binding protein, partial [Usitatibacteraceae bacterium]|nr:4Fe-4S binding protein [Usitatibacteraceae bacterium]
MLSHVGEGKLRAVRGLLVVCWLVLIVSLFWDPVTPEFTRADNVASPFHLQGKQVVVQGKVVEETPYAMSNRIWWTMIIPLLPLTFMVVGHETWRRLCPLSFVSQIPRYLGIQRKRPSLDKKSGKVTRLLALPARDGWARRNVWYIQFFLLYLALNARVLLVNSDRIALASFFIAVIVISMAVGYFWGGKTWCNYVCPINIVQKIYTEPRGILESSAHIDRKPISQSMCRAPGKDGDKSICVGCTPSCGDIDLEKSHWDSVLEKPRRNVYYMFFGLVLGFYCFYYFYSGGWDYYFSGTWTHEADQLGQIMGPGLYLNGQSYAIPKLVTSPLIIGAFILLSWGAGILLENAYRRLRTAIGKPLPEAEFMNQCLAFSAYVTINVFYLFGGRPNLSLLPTPALRLVDILIVMLTTTWFLLVIQRSPLKYRREGLASSLLEQLRSFKVDVSRYLEGRKLEELKPDEVYVLAKTLPQFSREQKVAAYRNILEDALQRGKTNSSASLEVLREVRTELGVTDEEHSAVLEELGASGDMPLDPDQAASQESWVRLGSYRRAIELAVVAHVEGGVPLAKVLDVPSVSDAIRENRELYRITPSEHESVMAQVTGGGGLLFERARGLIEPMVLLSSVRLGLASLMSRDDDSAALSRLLSKVLQQRLLLLCNRQLSTLLTLGDSHEARWLAGNLASTLGADLDVALAEPVSAGATATWEETLATDIVVLLRGGKVKPLAGAPATELPPVIPYRRVMDASMDLAGNLAKLAEDVDPRIKALAVTALS